jgi:DNA polymerase-1
MTSSSNFEHGEAIAIAIGGSGTALVGRSGATIVTSDAFAAIGDVESAVSPRWVWWSKETATEFVRSGIRPLRCWDLAAVHRLLEGGWRGDPSRVWALRRGLDPGDAPPRRGNVDLFTVVDDPDRPVLGTGHLHPEWAHGSWRGDVDRTRRWAELALDVQRWQAETLARLADHPTALTTARSESAAELLCAELETDGLPLDRAEAERIIATFIGDRPLDAADERRATAERDERVLLHLGAASREGIDLRNPASVKSLLRRVGIEVDDTRAWRLERRRGDHPIVDAILDWRRAERIATTFGYRWLDQHVGDDDRLRGTWSASDGAAGRMTATAGLHNLPAELRPAIAAEAGHVFVRADLGQIEPRILAAVSGDAALAAATAQHDMYAPVAAELGVEREVAKVAVLGAMYGQTTGHGAAARRELERAYPVAMDYLTRAARRAEGGNDLRTHGGRLVRMSTSGPLGAGTDEGRTRAAARGRYGRNALVQGAAAEFFKTWAAVVRARIAPAQIVLCLHDELLVHTPAHLGSVTAGAVDAALTEAAVHWTGGRPTVRFVADTAVVDRWSDAC